MAKFARTTRIVCCAVLAACTPRLEPAPASPGAATTEGLSVRLTWSAAVDLDLYVTTPRGETIYYANPGPAFVVDARCDAAPSGRLEEVRWRNPAPGRYRVGVDFPEACAGDVREAAYRVVVDLDGRREEYIGTARHVVRDAAVLEVVVP